MKDPRRKTVHEAYAFACLSCGRGWERTYVIEHLLDEAGQPFVEYYIDDLRVPSPLNRPVCSDCESHKVRVMRAGLVAAVERAQLP